MSIPSPTATTPIRRILIANRGEIACRVIKTARERGIQTIAVFSDADRRARHVRMADEAIHIGEAASAASYLVIDRIVAAAVDARADAVHPGYGFLSENARFAEALAAAGIRFIGPGVRAIEAMGDKIESKKLAKQAGVSTVPGHPDAVADGDEAYRVAEQIGCPVMLKASAGGGGKGMRIARSLDAVREGFDSARSEARSSFGDDRVFVEKFIDEPRHIEIQIIADTHGNTLYLGERECSIQRRHQKVIEEAPSSFISADTRKAMGEQAVALAAAVDYCSAGTVEFIVDAEENFYFLEMNTRLQVEHPVTEVITGLDLVGLMIDVANGASLPLTQADVTLEGWAFEARVYAEDVDRGFLPSTGRITHYDVPTELPGIRVDTGIEAGDEISMHYDPMIAKLVSWGPDRDSALDRMQQAIDRYRINGLQHNLPFLAALFAHPAVREGDLNTGFIEQHFPDGFNSRSHAADTLPQLPLLAAWLERTLRNRDTTIGRKRVGQSVARDTLVVVDGASQSDIEEQRLEAVAGDWHPGEHCFIGSVDGVAMTVGVKYINGSWLLTSRGSVRRFHVLESRVAALLPHMPAAREDDSANKLLSPMPGLLVGLRVKVGDRVDAGQEVAVIEAMKMENILRASQAATVAEILCVEGDSLAVDAVIMTFEP